MIDSLTNKKKILKNFLDICVLDGWNNDSLGQSIEEAGFGAEDQNLIFPNAIHSLTDFFIEQGNEEFLIKSKKINFSELRVRNKIKELVRLRLLIESDNKNALRALLTISKGRRIPALVKNAYKISDLMWSCAGDSSTDFNFYTKRAILSKVFTRTLIYFISDQSKNNEKSWDFLDDQIEKVMKIGEVKMKIKKYISKAQDCAAKACNLKEGVTKLPFIRLFNLKNKF
jgi:ubiquinone biosynthesis protein COQ9